MKDAYQSIPEIINDAEKENAALVIMMKNQKRVCIYKKKKRSKDKMEVADYLRDSVDAEFKCIRMWEPAMNPFSRVEDLKTWAFKSGHDVVSIFKNYTSINTFDRIEL